MNSKPPLVGANRQKTLSQGKFVDNRRAQTTIIQTTASEPDRERVIPGLPPEKEKQIKEKEKKKVQQTSDKKLNPDAPVFKSHYNNVIC